MAFAFLLVGGAQGQDEIEAALSLCDGESCAAAPALETHIDITVTGIIARTRVTQRFYNSSADWVEGVYVFPLPEGAAVDHLLMYVGDRVVQGRIEEREQARASYTRARDAGIKASLLEQDRPNLFRTSIANIGPDEEIEIDIELQHLVRYDAGEMRLRFPTVVMRRYSPAVGAGETADDDPIVELTNAVSRSLHPIHPLTLEVIVDAGYPLQTLYSPSHRIEVEDLDDSAHFVSLRGEHFADRDFVLAWRPDVGTEPAPAVFLERVDGETFALLMLLPNAPSQEARTNLPREVVYVIDSSGSMGGPSLRFAKLALLMALDQLAPGDYFDIIDFDSEARSLFDGSVAAADDAVDRARTFVDGLVADGGTNIAAALDLALAPRPTVTDVRQVVFITDGAVGNEAEIFAQVADRIGDTRLFTVGIGTAPNAHFMRKAAQFGRGTYTFIGSTEEISDRMTALFDKLDSAVLTHLEVDWHDLATPDVAPQTVPDLYAGEPLVLTARLAFAPEHIEAHGLRNGEPWAFVGDLAPDRDNEVDRGIGRLWARRAIEDLMDDLALGGDRDRIRDEVVALALDHDLVTKFTSLVAVDISPSAPAGASVRRQLPLHQAATALPSTATPSALYAWISGVLILCGWILRPRRAFRRSSKFSEET
jgi:Ca-activated chloride channel family protein